MGIFDSLKKQKKPQPVKEAETKKEKEAVKREDVMPAQAGAGDANVYGVIKEPIVTERATNMASMQKYVFKVDKQANKSQVRKAVERLYKDVRVKHVHIINTRGKQRRLGRFEGYKPGYKKAIVTLKEGTIDVIARS